MKKLLFSLSLLIFLTSCSLLQTLTTVEKPEISIQGVSISSVGISDATLKIKLDVSNKNSFPINLSSLGYNIVINDYNVGNGVKNNLSIPASGIGTIELPITIKYSNLPSIFKSIIEKKSLKYKVYGRGYIKTSFTTLSFPYTSEKNLSF